MKSFCPVPWNSLFVATDGCFKSCVAAYSAESKGELVGVDGHPRDVFNTSVYELRNSPELKNLRKNMLNGRETPNVCQRCIEDEQKGLRSRRELEKAKKFLSAEAASAFTTADGEIDLERAPLHVLDVKLGNLCNLSCRTCHPSQSSGWYEEWLETRHKGFKNNGKRFELSRNSQNKITIDGPGFDWFKHQDFWRQVISPQSQLREIHFSGGEPLLSRQHVDILEALVENGLASQLTLTYNSNLSSLPKHTLKLWESFQRVQIGVSVDAVGALNNFVRHPSDFEKIANHLRQLDASPANVEFWITSTLSLLNIRAYPELVSWILRENFKKMNRWFENKDAVFFLSAHVLRQPAFLSPQALPPRAKARVHTTYNDFILRLRSENGISETEKKYVIEHLKAFLIHMDAADLSQHLTEYHGESLKSDKYRGHSFSQFEAEIWNDIEEHLKNEKGLYGEQSSGFSLQ